MKKRIVSLICTVALSAALAAEPVFAVNNVNQTMPESVGESESIEAPESLETVRETKTETYGETQKQTETETESQKESVKETSEAETDQTETLKNPEAEEVLESVEEKKIEFTAEVSEDGTSVELKLNGYSVQGANEIEFDILSPEALNDQAHKVKAEKKDDIYQYKEDLKIHKKTGTYTVKAYEKKSDTERELIKEITFEVLSVSSGAVTAETVNEKQFKVTVDAVNPEALLDKLKVKVWTVSENECKWYDAERQDDGRYAIVVDVKNHNNYSGKYFVSVYAVLKNGAEECVQNTEVDMLMNELTSEPKAAMFSMRKTAGERIEISNQNSSNGTFDVRLYLNRPEKEIRSVSIPVWNAKDQSDIYWYSASRQEDGSYLATVNVKNHKYHLGRYIVHSYVLDKQGNMNYIKEARVEVNSSIGDFSQTSTGRDDSIRLNLNSLVSQGIAEKVYFAVWSDKNGQDDIYWYEASAKGNDYSSDVMFYNHKSTGRYYAHAYMLDKNGQMNFLKGITFNVVSLPEEKIETGNTNDVQGSFDVKLYLNRPMNSIDTVYVAAWSAANQGDIYWYEAKRQLDGTYLVKVNVRNHSYHTGKYYLHGYVRDKQGNMVFVDGTTKTLKTSSGDITEASTGKDYSTRLILSDVQAQGMVEKIYFAVWSAKNGQDDIYWYEAGANKNKYSSDVLFFNHRDVGKYYAHAYMLTKSGQMIFLKDKTFNVDSLPEEKVEVINVNQSEGTFDVNVYLTRPQNMTKSVYVPVWTTKNQSDIYWYKANKQSDGSYKVKVNAMNHQWHSGHYYVHVYAETPDGKMQYIKDSYANLKLGRKVAVESINTRSVKVRIYGVNDKVKEMKFPAWSLENGQDDIVWYTPVKNSDGSWSAEIHTRYHSSAGDFLCDIYTVEDNTYTCIERVEFNIAEKWEGSWRWIDGYKRYINSNGEIDNDVSRLVTGPYLIKVYKWSNYLIVYAKDENGEYKVPVKAMITSCGNPTPTGTYYSPMKFRWLTMVGGSKAQWCTQISGDYLFHSVPYRIADPTTLYTDLMYNYLGTTQSLGCIRLQAGDAKWIYDNCELGTEIYITPHESSGPIAKPAFNPIPSWHTWDPTDPNTRYLCNQHGCH